MVLVYLPPALLGLQIINKFSEPIQLFGFSEELAFLLLKVDLLHKSMRAVQALKLGASFAVAKQRRTNEVRRSTA